MSASFGNSNSQEVELNITPIIDCFTVLITFLLASAAFLQIGILDAGIAAPSSVAPKEQPPVELSVKIRKDNVIEYSATGRYSKKLTLKVNEKGKPDVDTLVTELAAVKGKFPQVQAISLSADDDVPYLEIVVSMDKIRKQMPGVLLGGF